jgi:hypothetical protein
MDTRYKTGNPRRYPIDWAFCSRRCQDTFHMLYGSWKRAQDDGLPQEAVMVDATPLEKAAMRMCLKFFGEAAGAIGFDKPLGAYSEAEALMVIEAIVTAYVDEMAAQHALVKYPPVRMPDATPVNDPIRESAPAIAVRSIADMEDDLPWETTP